MRRTRLWRILAVLLATLLWASAASSQTFTTIDHPLGAKGTYAWGISGSNVVGYYQDSSNRTHGFLYDGSTYTTIDYPSSPYPQGDTWVYGISGSNIVGEVRDWSGLHYGFLSYPGGPGPNSVTIWKGLNDPSGPLGQTYAFGVSGSNVVGYYQPSSGTSIRSGFLFNGSTWTQLDDPLAGRGDPTYAFGVSDINIVGCYLDSSITSHGFLYDGSTYATLDYPLASGTSLYGISDSTVVGDYTDSLGYHGCLYNGSMWTTLDDPLGTQGTYARGVSGNNVVGYYEDSLGNFHGFIADVSVPEPSTVALLGVGAVALLGFTWRNRRSK